MLKKGWRIIRPCSNDFQQWLWYTRGHNNRIARFVCEYDIPLGNCNIYKSRDVFMDALLEKSSDCEMDEGMLLIYEDEYIDTPRFIAPRDLKNRVSDWWLEYWDVSGYPRPVPQSISTAMRFNILKRDAYRCCLCGRTAAEDRVRLEIDHLVPRWRGGSAFEWNLWVLCHDCNHGKSGNNL